MSTEDPGESETHNTPLNEKISGIPKEKIKSISIVNEIVDDTLLYNTILTAVCIHTFTHGHELTIL